MIYYTIMLIISLLFAELYRKKNNKVFIFLSMLPFILVAGLRYDVGTDYMYRYIPEISELLKGGNPQNLEIGFKLFVRIIQLFTKDIQTVFFVSAIFIYGIIFSTIFKRSDHPVITILLFFSGGYFFESMNIMRQYMAMALLICALFYLYDKEIWKWLICILFATMLHTISLAFIITAIPYFLNYDLKKFGIVIVGCILFGFFGKPIIQIILENTRFNIYFTGKFAKYTQGDFQLVLFTFNLCILMLYGYLFYQHRQLLDDSKMKMFMCLQMIAVACCGMTAIMFITARFIIFFSIFQIYAIPYIFKLLNEKREKMIFLSIFAILFIVTFTYLYIIHNVNECLPYQFYFNMKNIKKIK